MRRGLKEGVCCLPPCTDERGKTECECLTIRSSEFRNREAGGTPVGSLQCGNEDKGQVLPEMAPGEMAIASML